MRQRVIGHGYVRPDRLDEFLLGDQASGIFHQITQDLECPRAQFDLAIAVPERTAGGIERISLKAILIRWSHLRWRLTRCKKGNSCDNSYLATAELVPAIPIFGTRAP
jgi:hypothetical protein